MVRLIKEGKVAWEVSDQFRVSICANDAKILARRFADNRQFSLIPRAKPPQPRFPWCCQEQPAASYVTARCNPVVTDTFSRESVRELCRCDGRTRSHDFNEPKLSRQFGLRDALSPMR